MARKLHSLERKKIEGGKPKFQSIDWSGEGIQLPGMSAFVNSDSLLVFDMLNINGYQDWLTIPTSLWKNFKEFKILKETAETYMFAMILLS